jgi:hypothetical protein
MRTIFALFEGYREARSAVEELLERKFDERDMNVIVQELTAKGSMDVNFKTANVDKTRRLGGEAVQGLDQLLSGRQPLTMPDVGAVYAAGQMASVMTGEEKKAKRTRKGGLKEALMAFDVPDEIAEFYKNGVLDGGVLLWVRTDDVRAAEAAGVLSDKKGEEVANYT